MTFLLGFGAVFAATAVSVIVLILIFWLFDNMRGTVLIILGCIFVSIAMYQALTSIGQSIQDNMESPAT